MFRLLASMGTFVSSRKVPTQVNVNIYLRHPLIGVMDENRKSWSLLFFILFMLSSTAFDGIQFTTPFVSLYWVHIADVIKPWLGGYIVSAFPSLKIIYSVWKVSKLALSPLFYFAIYILAIYMIRLLVKNPPPVK